MSAATREVVELMEILPESDQKLALELVRKLVLALDPDFTKVTPAERAAIDAAAEEIARGETVSHDAINWD